MPTTRTIQVPHLGGISAGYALSGDKYDPSKPTCVLINSMCMTTALYKDQFEDASLTSAVNLLAIEPLGHGSTSCASEHFTYWDSAIMALQVLDALGIQKAFALGTSQGGWIVTRMALLAPERVSSVLDVVTLACPGGRELIKGQVLGLVLLGTSMDCESVDSRSKGCWDPLPLLKPFLDGWTSDAPTPDFVVEETWCKMVGAVGFGTFATEELVSFWTKTLQEVYRGNEGRKKVRMALACLLERDGLLLRLGDVKCPVYWLQGTDDTPFATRVPEEQIQLFTRSKEAKLEIVEGGAHYLNATHPKRVDEVILEMVKKSGA
ncbi:Alpha/Beta hydrolase protein [Aspergillus desertorum]